MALLSNVQDLISQYDATDDVAKKNKVTISIQPLGESAAGSSSGGGGTPQLSTALASAVPATSTTGSSSAGVGSSMAPGSAAKASSPAAVTTPTGPVGAGANGATIVPSAYQLTRNPQLVSTPAVQMDDIAASQIAQQRFQAQKNYLSILQDLGFVDDAGNFIPGMIETEAVRQRQELNRQLGLAESGVNEDASRGGTVFSGRRVQNLQRASEPIVNQLAQLETDVPRLVSQRYQEAQDVLRDYEIQQSIILADMAARRAAAEMARQSGGGTGGGTGITTAAPDAPIDYTPPIIGAGNTYPNAPQGGAYIGTLPDNYNMGSRADQRTTQATSPDDWAAAWANLNAKYAGRIASSGNEANGQPYVILIDGQKVYG